jgi:hypothetical protein
VGGSANSYKRDLYFEGWRMTILDIISDGWLKEKLPIIDGLVKSDGSFYAIMIDEECRPIEMNYQATSFDISRENYSEYCSSVLGFASITHLGITYHCGEGSQGSDGFLLAVNSDNNAEWLFFSQESNPFEKLWIENDEIHVMSNLNIEWIFPVGNPERLRSIKHPL